MDELFELQADSDTSHPKKRSLKFRIARIIGVFLILQGIVAALVMRRAKVIDRQRVMKRPDTYPCRSFESVQLENGDDSARIYMDGPSLMRDVVRDIDAAQDRVYVESFIWVDDEAGRAVRDALVRAAARGVTCNAIYDWSLSDRSLTPEWFGEGVSALAFRPIKLGKGALRPTNMIRDHRKIFVIDGTIAWVGGYNLGDEYLLWRDTHLRLEGSSVGDVENAFVDFWNQHRPLRMEALKNVDGRSWDPHVLVHRNDPSMAIFPIRGMYLEAIDRAEKRIWFTNAYFVPDRSFRMSLIAAARRGVDVRVMVPAQSNHPLADVLSHGSFDELLSAGVRIFQFRHFMVHAKTAVIDDSWSTIGTANLDRWSMLGNFEINLEIRSNVLAAQMMELFEFDMEYCRELDLIGWHSRPQTMRSSERILQSLSPLM